MAKNSAKPEILVCVVILSLASPNVCSADEPSGEAGYRKNYIGTSLMMVSSFIPGIGASFYEIDYGRMLSSDSAILCGLMYYGFASPMAMPMGESLEYPGDIVSYGPVAGYRRMLWKGLFFTQLANPLVLAYRDGYGNKIGDGFMVLFASRVGWHFDFRIGPIECYLEAAGEINYWTPESGMPDGFSAIDDLYPNFVFAPALNAGIKF